MRFNASVTVYDYYESGDEIVEIENIEAENEDEARCRALYVAHGDLDEDGHELPAESYMDHPDFSYVDLERIA